MTHIPRHFFVFRPHARRYLSDTGGMKHISDARKSIQLGNGPAALEIIDNLLELAPRNAEALRIKSEILDQWGHFDASLEILRRIASIEGPESTVLEDYEDRLREEREAMVFSEMTAEGRWYFAFPRAQVWVSLYGFVGCGVFLLMSTHWAGKGSEALSEVLMAFVVLVLLPWIALIVIHFRGVKKILVGIDGIKVCMPYSSRLHRWSEVTSVVMEYDPNVLRRHLVLRIYGKQNPKVPIETFNVTEGRSVVQARRHFVRNIHAYVDCVTYLARPDAEGTLEASRRIAEASEKNSAPDDDTDSSRKTDSNNAA